jgi:DNA-binding MarR family transcriptional regulator
MVQKDRRAVAHPRAHAALPAAPASTRVALATHGKEIMPDDFDLQDYFPYLLNRTAVEIVNAFSVDLREFGITLQMWRVLAALWHDGPMRLGELAGLTSIEISTLSRTVGAMQRKGLVSRRRGERDARAVQVALTSQGRAMTERIIPLALSCERRAIAGLSPEEGRLLRGLLRRVFEAMRRPPER